MTDHGSTYPGDRFSGHPTVDQIADFCEDLLTSTAQTAVQTHLAQCKQCHATHQSLLAVSTTLGDAAISTAMPPDVVSRIQSALTREAASRAAAPGPDLSNSQAPDAPSRAAGGLLPRHRRWAPRLLSAAAALALIAVGYSVWPRGGGAESGATAADSSVAGSEDGAALTEAAPNSARDESQAGGSPQEADAPQEDVPRSPSAPSADPSTVRQLAERYLAESEVTPEKPSAAAGGFAARQCGTKLASDLNRTLISVQPVTWDGKPAYLALVSGPSGSTRPTAEAFVIRQCDDLAANAEFSLPVDTP